MIEFIVITLIVAVVAFVLVSTKSEAKSIQQAPEQQPAPVTPLDVKKANVKHSTKNNAKPLEEPAKSVSAKATSFTTSAKITKQSKAKK